MTDAKNTKSALELQLAEDLKQAMRDKNELARDTLRMLKSELLREQVNVDDASHKQTEVDEMGVVLRAVKTRRESAAEYQKGGRADLAERELAEVAVLEAYLPKALSEDEAKAAIQAIATELGVTEKKQMGQLMGAVRERHRGTIDGKLAAKIAGQLLS